MAPIVVSTEISRSPQDVFRYVTDPTKLSEWQESVVRAEASEMPVRAGTKARVTRRVGRREMTSSGELAELNPPTNWKVRGLGGPVRGDVRDHRTARRGRPLPRDARARPPRARHRQVARPAVGAEEGRGGDAAQYAAPQAATGNHLDSQLDRPRRFPFNPSHSAHSSPERCLSRRRAALRRSFAAYSAGCNRR